MTRAAEPAARHQAGVRDGRGGQPSSAPQLRALEPKAEAIIRSVATKAFHSSLLGAAGFALLALLVVVVPLPGRHRRAATSTG